MMPVLITGVGAVVNGAGSSHVRGMNDEQIRAACKERARGNLARAAQMVLLAAAEALGAPEEHSGTGLAAGTCYANVGAISTFAENCLQQGPQYASPLLFPDTVMNAPAGYAAIALGLKGPTATISTGLISGSLAVGYALQLIRSGLAERMVACGMDVTPPDFVVARRGTGLPVVDAGGGLLLEAGTPGAAGPYLCGFAHRPGSLQAVGSSVLGELLEQMGCALSDLDLIVLTGRTGLPDDPLGQAAVARLVAARTNRSIPVLLLAEQVGDTLAAAGPVGVAVACRTPGVRTAVILDFDEAGICGMGVVVKEANR